MKAIILLMGVLFTFSSLASSLSINITPNHFYIVPGDSYSCTDNEKLTASLSVKGHRVRIADLELNWIDHERHFQAEKLTLSIDSAEIVYHQSITGEELDYALGTKNGLVTEPTQTSSTKVPRPFNYLPCSPSFGGIDVPGSGLIQTYGYLTLEGRSFDPDGSNVEKEYNSRKVLLTYDFK